jgi:hypothetical protein
MTEEKEARQLARKAAREAKRKEEAARADHNAAIPVTVKHRRKIEAPGQQGVSDGLTRKQRKRKEQAAHLAAAKKIPKKSRVIRTYTDEEAKARWKGQPTKVIIKQAYPGYESPKPPDVDIQDIAVPGGAPSLGKRHS